MRLLLAAGLSLLFSSAIAQNYFQQDVAYTIHVSLDDVKHELRGDEKIVYTNNSPDTLHEIYFHLWPNAYKNKQTALAKQLRRQGDNRMILARPQDMGWISKLDFKVDAQSVQWEYLKDTLDVALLHLSQPLAPHQTITITTPFHVKIPSATISRLGHDGQAYYITQWYPKPAVYDAHGWNYFPYLDMGEYYSEFGSFDVHITLPANYVVGATGDLVDGAQELAWLEKNVEETKQQKSFSKSMKFPKSDTAMKTLHYRQDKVHDFAWFADKRYHVAKGDIQLESGRKVTAWAFFTNECADLWRANAIGYIKDATHYLSDWVGEYPYNNVSAADVTAASGGGMEYPTITAIGTVTDAFDLETVLEHEVGHNWFYGILGNNEREHPWIDEGMNQFVETRYVYTKYANDSAAQMESTSRFGKAGKKLGLTRFNHRQMQHLRYQYSARNNTDQKPDLNAELFDRYTYGADAYRKTALTFDYLKWWLGDSLFDKCMHAYYEKWKFKHPYPQDVEDAFESTSGKNLDWVFKDMLQSTAKLYELEIDSLEKIPDYRFQNIPKPLDLQWPGNLEDNRRTQIFAMPIVGWNNYDKWMLGAAVTNLTIPEKKIEYLAAPMYSFSLKEPAGGGRFSYNYYLQNSYINKINFSTGVSSYAYRLPGDFGDHYTYYKIKPSVTVHFLDRIYHINTPSSLSLQYYWIHTSHAAPEIEGHSHSHEKTNFYLALHYNIGNSVRFNPYNVVLKLGYTEGLIQSTYEYKQTFSYREKGYGLDLRAFVGINNIKDYEGVAKWAPFDTRLHMSGETGLDDFLLDDVYLGRGEVDGILSQQFAEKQGGFKVATYSGVSENWLAALNIKVAFPFKFFVHAFGDIGWYSIPENYPDELKKLPMYDFGFELRIIPDVFSIYMPIAYSKDIDYIYHLPFNEDRFSKYSQKIRFELNLSRLNPFKLRDRFRL